MSLAKEKRELRAVCLARRKGFHIEAGDDAAQGLADQFFSVLSPKPGSIISGYMAMGEEVAPMPLMIRLHENGYSCALPVVEERGQPLRFRHWRPGDPLVPGIWDIPVPTAGAREVQPDLMLVPLLAFDHDGYRLGYGGGFYDRTIEALRGRGTLAVGVAYSCQEMEAVPRGPHDQKLDWIVTEAYARPFRDPK
tara:strand:- start:711 stop:1292 length:582 start_codon:yes stop_codon:yes gene_type:complete